MVELARISDPALVMPSIATTLDIDQTGGQRQSLEALLLQYVQDKRMLLVLDNFEQVLDAALHVVGLLAKSPWLKVLVTSREALHVRGERRFHVPPLELPTLAGTLNLEALSTNPAVALFVERAQEVLPDFELTHENAGDVAAICVGLDGLPLGIELAAAWANVFSARQMRKHLGSRLKLPTRGARDLPARHRTLRGAIEWSYALLGEDEQRLFRRMAVFQGGRTLEALEAVSNYDGQLQLDVLEGVESLVSKSLLQPREGLDGEPRFWMLETIHEYAREKLEESGEADTLQRHHALYFMSLAEQAEPELQGPKQVEWLDRLEDEHDNIRAALLWARQSANFETGLRLAGAVWRFWSRRGYYDEGREQLASLLSVRAADTANVVPTIAPVPQPVRAKALNGAGYLAWELGDLPSARSPLEESLAIYEALGDKNNVALSLNNLGLIIIAYDREAGKPLFEKSLAIRRELGDILGIASSLHNLAFVAAEKGDYVTARHTLTRRA